MTASSKCFDVDDMDFQGIAELNDSTDCDDLLFYLSHSSRGTRECGSKTTEQLLSDSDSTIQNVLKGVITPTTEVGTCTLPDLEDECDNESELSYCPRKRKLCTSRNAVMARENRERKKKHLQTLETNIKNLTEENKKLKECSASQKEKIDSLQNEVMYLRSVLANESALASVLNRIVNVPGLKFSTSLCDESNLKSASTLTSSVSSKKSRSISTNSECSPLHQNKDKNCLDSDDPSLSSKITILERGNLSSGYSKENDIPKSEGEKYSPVENGGVCLHVSNNNVSLEFCPFCASNAVRFQTISGDHTYGKCSE